MAFPMSHTGLSSATRQLNAYANVSLLMSRILGYYGMRKVDLSTCTRSTKFLTGQFRIEG